MAELPDGFLEQLLLPENVSQLQSILTYHALNETVYGADLTSGEVTTLNGEPVTVTVDSTTGNIMINDANVVIADIAASNGVIHVLDKVLVSPSAAEALAGDATATGATTTVAAATTTAAAAAEEICSCSPTSYTFTLTLNQNCTDNTIQDNSGIFATDCFLGTLVATSASSTEQVTERAFTTNEFETFQRTIAADAAVEITSVSFIEFDTSGEFIVLSQDDTYLTTSLGQGDTVTFTSISNDLDPDVSASEQTELIPGGVMVTIKATYTDAETGEDLLVINRVAWNYVTSCDVTPLEVGDYLAWVTTVSLINAL